jgi:AraC-like DNA-binding protein
LVAGVASGRAGQQQALVRFSSFRPVDYAAARLWKDTIEYVKNCVLARDDTATPLVLGHCSRLLAAVTIATFPNTMVPEPASYDRADSGPALLRRAIAYMEANAGNDIALADVATAVHVTPRAVQYMFRRHLDTTPLQYLRRMRLDYAHRDLLTAERSDQTVTQIAARWGFMHTGRFAVLYRQAYGQSPHETLRG